MIIYLNLIVKQAISLMQVTLVCIPSTNQYQAMRVKFLAQGYQGSLSEVLTQLTN